MLLHGGIFGLLAIVPALLPAQPAPARTILSEPGYVGPETCATCHQSIWATYQRTGMSRSFYKPSPANAIEDFTKNNTYYHEPSDSYFTMLRKDGKIIQRRHQLDPQGRVINVMEKVADFVLGSGNNARAYLSRTPANTLVELPLAWYSEYGGYWAMNPGYDRPNHDGFRRTITYDCMFCHNAYPKIPAGFEQPLSPAVYSDPLPEGIDCQRCHGPGAKHVEAAKASGANQAAIKASIINPAGMNTDRQMEVCMQCHLETTSFPLPNTVLRYERGPFSYRPGQQLADFLLTFDHEPGKGRDDKFEIVNAAYRLRKSKCFLQSAGKMTCTTCHNPHDIPRGATAVKAYDAACNRCHEPELSKLTQAKKHPAQPNCASCHMPRRRTEDVVHVAATDHLIQRNKPAGDLLAPLPERHETNGDYQGKVVPYYPATIVDELYLGIAQVIQKSNLKAGIEMLSNAIAKTNPSRPEYYFQLAEAYRNANQPEKALPHYREALKRDPHFVFGLQKLGFVLRRGGQYEESAALLQRAARTMPENANTWQELGLTYRAQKKIPEAIDALGKAISFDPDMEEAHNNLGVIRASTAENLAAENAFREAIRIRPDYADAHANLAGMLSARAAFAEASYHFEVTLKLRPNDVAARYNYAMNLGRMRDYDGAQRQLEAAIKTEPDFADAQQLLGDLFMARGESKAAAVRYQEAVRVRPESGRAHLALASALFAIGEKSAAIPHLQIAAKDSDQEIRSQALDALKQLQK